jgi:hypothetical protein
MLNAVENKGVETIAIELKPAAFTSLVLSVKALLQKTARKQVHRWYVTGPGPRPDFF